MGNMDSLDLILTVAAFIVGIMLLTGHGDIFMKGGNADVRKKLYDEKDGKGMWNSTYSDWRYFSGRYVYYRTGL